MAATWRLSTRAVSLIGSPRPSWDSVESMIIGWPPSSAMPTSNEIRVRVEALSNKTAIARRTGERGDQVRVGLEGVGQVEHRGLLGRG